jgi:hypothetical protein
MRIRERVNQPSSTGGDVSLYTTCTCCWCCVFLSGDCSCDMGKSHDYSFLSLPGFPPFQRYGLHRGNRHPPDSPAIAKVRATPFIGYQYQSTRMLSSCRVSVERVSSRPYFSIGVEREGAFFFLSFVTKRVNLNCLPLGNFKQKESGFILCIVGGGLYSFPVSHLKAISAFPIRP